MVIQEIRRQMTGVVLGVLGVVVVAVLVVVTVTSVAGALALEVRGGGVCNRGGRLMLVGKILSYTFSGRHCITARLQRGRGW